MIPYSRQSIDEQDIAAVVQVLRSDWLTQGPAVERFETAVADYCGTAHAVAVCNATAALHLACIALELGPGDWLWTTPNTFVASANCGRYCGAQVDFVDIDPLTYNLSPTALADKLAWAQRRGCLPKVVVPVHFAGQPCDMQAIGALARRYGFRVLEDASHAIGATYADQRVGSGADADLTVFSFHPVKLITAAEGGMVVTREAALYHRLMRLRSHGITRDAALMTSPCDDLWYYEQLELGFNYRLSDLQCALGLSQLQRLDYFLTQRRMLASRYDDLLAPLPLVRPVQMAGTRSAYHLYPILLPSAIRRRVYEQLRAAGIGVNVHYIPVHRQPYYRNFGFRAGDFPVAEDYYARTISLPLYPGLSLLQQDTVVAALATALR